jgi:uncharacterized protein YicC (UPF0701 family)
MNPCLFLCDDAQQELMNKFHRRDQSLAMAARACEAYDADDVTKRPSTFAVKAATIVADMNTAKAQLASMLQKLRDSAHQSAEGSRLHQELSAWLEAIKDEANEMKMKPAKLHVVPAGADVTLLEVGCSE